MREAVVGSPLMTCQRACLMQLISTLLFPGIAAVHCWGLFSLQELEKVVLQRKSSTAPFTHTTCPISYLKSHATFFVNKLTASWCIYFHWPSMDVMCVMTLAITYTVYSYNRRTDVEDTFEGIWMLMGDFYNILRTWDFFFFYSTKDDFVNCIFIVWNTLTTTKSWI